jgi:hypothetical protein
MQKAPFIKEISQRNGSSYKLNDWVLNSAPESIDHRHYGNPLSSHVYATLFNEWRAWTRYYVPRSMWHASR